MVRGVYELFQLETLLVYELNFNCKWFLNFVMYDCLHFFALLQVSSISDAEP